MHISPPLHFTDEVIDRIRYAIVKQACNDYNSAYFTRKCLERVEKSRNLTEKEIKKLISAKKMESNCLAFFSWTVVCNAL